MSQIIATVAYITDERRADVLHQYRHYRLLTEADRAPLAAVLDDLTYVRRVAFEYRVIGRQRVVDWSTRTAHWHWLDAPYSTADTALLMGMTNKYVRGLIDRALSQLCMRLGSEDIRRWHASDVPPLDGIH